MFDVKAFTKFRFFVFWSLRNFFKEFRVLFSSILFFFEFWIFFKLFDTALLHVKASKFLHG